MARKQRGAPSITDILSGAARADADTLFALIHDVNPTSVTLPARERDRRYAIKAKLQSLLINHHAASLSFVPGESEGVVSIRHAALGYDACHAVVEELDDAARSFVRRALDEALSERRASDRGGRARPSARAASHGAPSAPAGPLGRGRAALEEYDFEGARSAFAEAFRSSGGSTEATLALLDLLLDHLADYSAAWQLARGMGSSARRHPQVRARVALAAARVGELDECERWLGGVEVAEAAQAWLVCAESALAEGALARAEALCRRAGEVAPHEGADVRRRLEAARRERLTALEARLETLRGTSWAEAVVAAESLILEFPESRAARTVLAAAASRAREERSMEQLRRARELAEEGSLEPAAMVLRGELAGLEGDLRAQVVSELASLHRRLEEQRAQREIDRVLSLLTTELEGGVRAFLALGASERRVVRERADRPALDLAERASNGRTPPDTVAAAAVALEEVLCAGVSTGARVLERLEPYAAALEALPEGRSAMDEARRRRDEELREAAERTFAEVELLARSGKARDALALAKRLDIGALGEELRAKVLALRERLVPEAEREELDETLRRTFREQRWFEVFPLAERLRALCAGDAEREHGLNTLVATARARIDAHYQVARFQGGYEGWFRRLSTYTSAAQPRVREDRDELVVDMSVGASLCLHRVDLRTGHAMATLVFTVPDGKPGPTTCVVRGGRAYLSTAADKTFVVALDTLDLEAEIHAPRHVAMLEQNFVALDDEPYLWTGDRADRCRIAPFSNPAAGRDIDGIYNCRPIPYRGRVVVVASKAKGDEKVLYGAAGRPMGPLGAPYSITELTTHPRDDCFLALGCLNFDRDDETIQLIACRPNEPVAATVPLPDVLVESVHYLVTSTDAGAVFLRYASAEDDGAAVLASFDESDGELRKLWQRPFAAKGTLVGDILGRRAFASVATDRGLAIVELHRSEPDLPPELEDDPPRAMRGRWVGEIGFCGTPWNALARTAPFGDTKGLTPRLIEARAQELVNASPGDVDRAVGVAHVLARLAVQVPGLEARILEPYEGAPTVRLWRAERAALAGRIDEARELLVGLNGVPASLESHALHVEAVVLAICGQADAAINLIDASESVCSCPVAELKLHLEDIAPARTGLLHALPGASRPGRRESSAAALVRILERVDGLLKAERVDQAIEELENTAVIALDDVQYLARAARCQLSVEALDEPSRARKRLILTQFVDAHQTTGILRYEMVQPQRWCARTLDELTAAARTWLDAEATRLRRMLRPEVRAPRPDCTD